ncbi:MAG: radical SAM protein [Actinomycetota bacterium]
MNIRAERDEVFLQVTKSICPLCKTVLDAEILVRDGRVLLSKRCTEHGSFEALLSSDADAWVGAQRYNRPGSIPLEFQTEERDGCPLDCGLCPSHKQHACVGLIEINSNCNLDCPVCFADSGHHPDSFSLSFDQVRLGLETFVRSEGQPEMVMFSGGEPTLHPELASFVRLANELGVSQVTINTNGIRLAKDEQLAGELASLGVSIYLQFDGTSATTDIAMRGRDLRALKERALQRCLDEGLRVTLVAAIEKGVNEHEVPAVLEFGLSHPAVNSVVYQPVTHAGRHGRFDPTDRMTNADVVAALKGSTPAVLTPDDFVPVPCCHPACRLVTYLLRADGVIVPIPRLLDVESHLDYVANRVLPDPSVRGALERLWSASAVAGTDATAEQLACATCEIDLPEAARDLARSAFMVVIQDFQDPYTLNVTQLMKCCVAQIVPDGRLIPFCAYNSVGYREAVRAALTGVPVEPAVPNAVELEGLLRRSPHGSMTLTAGKDT